MIALEVLIRFIPFVSVSLVDDDWMRMGYESLLRVGGKLIDSFATTGIDDSYKYSLKLKRYQMVRLGVRRWLCRMLSREGVLFARCDPLLRSESLRWFVLCLLY